MVSRKTRKEFGNHHFKPLGRPSNLTKEMEWEICEKMRDGQSNNKILQSYPISLKTIKEIRMYRNYFLDLP
jgi:DNA-binding NarL/FixJ family response regulator